MVAEVEVSDVNHGQEAENIGLGCALDMFKESEEVYKLIQNLKNICGDVQAQEVSLERFTFLLNQYQEQPHLLDPYLEKILQMLIDIVRNKNESMELKQAAFKFIKHIMKVRGFKVVVRQLPHEVADLEPVLQMLEMQDPTDCTKWDSSYVLILWLSIIVKIPFHMSRLDSFENGEPSHCRLTVMDRILNICKKYIHDNLASYFVIPTSFLLSHFISRSDVKEIYLKTFLDWNYEFIKYADNVLTVEQINFLGSLATLAAILKNGKREDLLPYAPGMLQKILESDYRKCNNSLLRKYAIKVIQRIGLTFLKPKLASWRYQRGSRSLSENLKATVKTVKEQVDTDVNEDFDVPEEVEEVIEQLLQGLKDSETLIRWSAAKGIGRVTGRLPKELADEVVGSVLELLCPRESDSAWHGGCLALAELGRRGLLLPQRLSSVVPLVMKALIYDDSRGYFSVGDHVRDAACYVAWSFARAYEADVLKPYVNQIASGLLIVSLFDREIKCRRAASAAFQENVGRQGTFPHGIDILTAADYFSVGIRQNSFLKISVFVAQFEEYTIPLIDHLIELKIDHWDAVIRELTASALHNLTPLAPDYMVNIFDQIVKKTKSSDLNCRHGALLAVGEVLHALFKNNKKLDVKEVADLIYYYKDKRYFIGSGGEILRQAFCELIRNCSLSEVAVNLDTVNEWQQFLGDCLHSEVAVVRAKAITALSYFLTQYYKNDKELGVTNITEKYVEQLSSLNQASRMGYALALGEFPKFLLMDKLNNIIFAFLESLKISEMTSKWVESRRDSIKALISIIKTVGVESLFSKSEIELATSNETETSVATNVGSKTRILTNNKEIQIVDEIFVSLLAGLSEYTNDTRGDIGAWVREASMTGLEELVVLVANLDRGLLNEKVIVSIMSGIAQQAVERIDRTRLLAGQVFSNLLHHKEPVIPNIPYREKLIEIFPLEECKQDIMWSNECETFPKFVQLLTYPCYTYNVMQGLILSIGGMTERLVKHSSASLFSFLKSIRDVSEVSRICNSITEVFTNYQYNIRVVVPLFSFLDRLLGSGVIRCIVDDPNNKFCDEIFRLSKLEVAKHKDFKKLSNSMDVFCQLVQVKGNISAKSLSQMSVFLCHKLKAVRKSASTKLYECLIVYGDESCIPDENLEDVMTILSETNWELEREELRPTRNKLCELMNVSVPTALPQK